MTMCVRAFLFVAVAFAVACKPLRAQSIPHVTPFKEANLTHLSSGLSIDAREARPLRQAVAGIREEYGWLVDYEDPVYADSDLVDDTSPAWRATHAKDPGVTRPGGEKFSCVLSPVQVGADGSTKNEGPVLTEMISDYNSQHGGPGTFALVDTSSTRFDIVGTSRLGSVGIFGVQIDLPTEQRSAADTLGLIFDAVSKKTGQNVRLGFASMSVLARSQITIGGSGALARQLLAAALDGTNTSLVWEALYDADSHTYVVNILPGLQNYYGASGEKAQVLLKPSRAAKH